ncbi:hypothetical protein CR513_22708, partial [Mucuna pruriens]
MGYKDSSHASYSNVFLGIANKVRLLRTKDSKIIEKIMLTITTLENTKDLSEITLAKVKHAF